jgi:hypothetical protein
LANIIKQDSSPLKKPQSTNNCMLSSQNMLGVTEKLESSKQESIGSLTFAAKHLASN